MKQLLALTAFAALLMFAGTNLAQDKKKVDPAFEVVKDDPILPRVLLIGDSISIGYTPATRKLLAGKANVHRIPENGAATSHGTKNIKKWLGEGKWDVIHFNWGLHDIRRTTGKPFVSSDDYEKNLRSLVTTLKGTGAKLIWASTTPVAEGTISPPRKNEDVIEYNKIAKKIVEENGIAINDLYAFALPHLAKIQLPVDVHFTNKGSAVLADRVAAAIEAALKK